ncbi:hypothetical protein CR513_23775, partial [Mucuna pruriens]
MPVTRNQVASSTNEAEEDMLQRYKETLKIVEEREEELQRQLAAARATVEKPTISTPSPAEGTLTF